MRYNIHSSHGTNNVYIHIRTPILIRLYKDEVGSLHFGLDTLISIYRPLGLLPQVANTRVAAMARYTNSVCVLMSMGHRGNSIWIIMYLALRQLYTLMLWSGRNPYVRIARYTRPRDEVNFGCKSRSMYVYLAVVVQGSFPFVELQRCNAV